MEGLPEDVQTWLRQAMKTGNLESVQEVTYPCYQPHDSWGINIAGVTRRRSLWEILMDTLRRARPTPARIQIEALVYTGPTEGFLQFGDVLALVTRHNGRTWELKFKPRDHERIKDRMSMHYLATMVG